MIEKLIKIQNELKAPKNQTNNFGKYKYRNLEDIQEAVKPLLFKHGLFLTLSDEVIEKAGVLVNVATVLVTDGDKEFSVKAEAGIDLNKKGMDTSQTFGTASSYSRKYAMSGMFLIDDTKDADSMDNSKAKPALKSNSNQFIEAVSFIKKGGSMDQIEQKYNVSADVKKEIAAKLV
tara:strand:- start:2394 stop:2921 length:528 start_codon:yes stop_codon:yes gene_type:complete